MSRPGFALLLAATLFVPAAHANSTTDSIITCFNFINAQDYPRALAESAALLKIKKPSREIERYARLCRGRALSNTGQFKAALPELQRVEALSRSQEELAVAYNRLGNVYSNMGDLANAELYDNRSLQSLRAMGDKGREAAALNNLALIYDDKGDPDKALEYYQMSLALQDKEGEKATTYNNMALIYLNQGDSTKAIETFQKAMDISRRAGNYQQLAQWQLNLGGAYRQAKEYVKAEENLAAGLEGVKKIGDRYWEAMGCKYLGWLKQDQDDISGAREALGKAQRLFSEIGAMSESDAAKSELASLNKLQGAK